VRNGKKKARGPAGAILRASGKDGPQLVRSGGHRWTEEAEEIFLDALAASNNAKWAAAQCGFSTEAIYKRARRDPRLAERMADARALAHGRIDEALARAAEDFLAGNPPAPGSPLQAMTVQDAIAIQKHFRASRNPEGGAHRPAWPARPRSLGEAIRFMRSTMSSSVDWRPGISKCGPLCLRSLLSSF
jgi:hypothetical protein